MLNIISYWRNSLVDRERLSLQLNKLSLVREISIEDIKKGIIPQKIADQYFNNQKNTEIKVVEVLLAPIIMNSNAQQGRKRNTDFIPLWIPAEIDTHGVLHVKPESYPWIPRNYLEPCDHITISLGLVDDLDNFLSKHPIPENNWYVFLKFALSMFKSVTGQNLYEFDYNEYTREETPKIGIVKNLEHGTTQHILKLYEDIIKSKKRLPLLAKFASLDDVPASSILNEDNITAGLYSQDHLGQMSNRYPVSPSQREAIDYFLTLHDGEILAVNGPPGTGKTTTLQSIIATLWVKAAYMETDPPVIVAASANNQAVTNIIESFGSIKEEDQTVLSARWLPSIKSYGLYLPSSKKEPGCPYQTELNCMNKIHTFEYIQDAQKYFLNFFSKFSCNTSFTLNAAKDYLHNQLAQTVDFIKETTTSFYFYLKAENEKNSRYPNGFYAVITEKEAQIKKLELTLNKVAQIYSEWNQHLFEKPWWFVLEGVPFLAKFITNKNRLRNSIFFTKHHIDYIEEKDFSNHLNTKIKKITTLLDKAKNEKNKIIADKSNYEKALCKWNSLKDKLNVKTEDELLSVLDCKYRYKAFKLATHYWEGQWLLQELKEPTNSNAKLTARLQMNKWRKYAKITPCFVSTFYMVPKFFKILKDNQNEPDLPLYNFIDLLIIDEAGQVSPEIAGASFALARKALVVGDTFQIEPVWEIPRSVDISNVISSHLASTKDDAEVIISEKSLGASSGSVMKIAQRASKYQKFNDTKGLYLTEHQRCVPEIIAYCNELAYKGRLNPQRKSTDSNYPLPHLGYQDVKGTAVRVNGSYKNLIEAHAIIDWIKNNKVLLLQLYPGKSIVDIIGIITPFKKQSDILSGLLMKDETLKNIKLGTVHALQGAEKPIIIFSTVYDSKSNPPYFFDKGVNMLNVAVSRAKDSFLLFGDKSILNPQAPTPSGLLAKYLFLNAENDLNRSKTQKKKKYL